MPEAALIPGLIAGAQQREAAMVEQGATLFDADRPASLEAIGEAIGACSRCPIGCNGTRAVMGEGLPLTKLMIVGEQPGDTEEQQSRPFVGPAGRLLDEHLEQAGIDRAEVYVTNAVKHFKFVQRGKRRLHQTPTAKEIDICRWWLDSERALVRPRHILALGASAARGLLGRTASIGRERGAAIAREDATTWLTVHPSFLLRVPENREREEEKFQADLRTVAVALAKDR
jgi:DNA polymerase